MTTLRGKWAEGITPKHFAWIVTDRLAISERPGGSGASHRRVRRTEEIQWLKRQGFTRVVSLLHSPHNLAAYEEAGIEFAHLPLPTGADLAASLQDLYGHLDAWFAKGERVLVHADVLNEELISLVGGYLLWIGAVAPGARVVVILEQLTKRNLGFDGRRILNVAEETVSRRGHGRPEAVP